MKKGIGVGVLFIVIGLLFLLNNLEFLDISIGDFIRVYWPLILIWLGIDKLLRKEKKERE
jgi:lia operon protein LiaF